MTSLRDFAGIEDFAAEVLDLYCHVGSILRKTKKEIGVFLRHESRGPIGVESAGAFQTRVEPGEIVILGSLREMAETGDADAGLFEMGKPSRFVVASHALVAFVVDGDDEVAIKLGDFLGIPLVLF